MANPIKELLSAAKLQGAEVKQLTVHHFQIKGRLLVNYYPNSRAKTAYVAGTTYSKKNVTATEAVTMAFTPPPVVGASLKDKRSSNGKHKRMLMLRKSNKCHWCSCVLTMSNSTIEHVIPLHRGGLDNANNRVLSCAPCNHNRGHDMPELSEEVQL